MKETPGSDTAHSLNEEVKLHLALLAVFCVLYLDVKLKGRNLPNTYNVKGFIYRESMNEW